MLFPQEYVGKFCNGGTCKVMHGEMPTIPFLSIKV